MVVRLGNIIIDTETTTVPLKGLFSDLSGSSLVLDFKAIAGESDLVDQINQVDKLSPLEDKIRILTDTLNISDDQLLFFLAGNEECFDRDQDSKNILFKSELMSSMRKKFNLKELGEFSDKIHYSESNIEE